MDYCSVWYSFEGNGETQLVGVSSGLDGAGIFDTVLTVYSGSCEELSCLQGEGMTYQEFENSVLLDTVAGQTYTVLVSG